KFEGEADLNYTEATTDTRTSAGGSDVFVTAVELDGTYGWSQTFGSTMTDDGYSIDALSDDGPFVIGYAGGDTDFDPGEATDVIEGSNLFVTKYQSDGSYETTMALATSTVNPRGVAVGADYTVAITG